MITRLDHVQLAMPPGEEERARAFFRDIVGMREDVKPEPLAGRGGCWFSGGGAIIHLGVEREFVAQKKAHPAFCVRDVDALASRLKQAAFQVVWDDVLPGRKRFYTSDPFGNRVEFIRDGDGFGQINE
jgi:catechol 2,3-dioxygenase-like lactoylglutathione lyase family enzyme